MRNFDPNIAFIVIGMVWIARITSFTVLVLYGAPYWGLVVSVLSILVEFLAFGLLGSVGATND